MYIQFVEICLRGVTPISLEGFGVRWFYDARVQMLALWQVGPIIGLVLLLLLPVVFAMRVRYIMRAHSTTRFSDWEVSIASYYSSPFLPRWRHWGLVMIYRRVVLAAIVELTSSDIVRAIAVALFALSLLLVDWRVQPFSTTLVQRLESSCLALLTVEGILQIYSAALQSAAVTLADESLLAFTTWTTWACIVSPATAVAAIAVYHYRRGRR